MIKETSAYFGEPGNFYIKFLPKGELDGKKILCRKTLTIFHKYGMLYEASVLTGKGTGKRESVNDF